MHEAIIVGVDGSKYAERALEVSIDLAKHHGSRLIIATVYANDRFLTFGFDSPTQPAPPPPQEKPEAPPEESPTDGQREGRLPEPKRGRK